MPRKPAPPRLYLRPDDRTWIIRDGQKVVRTGCAEQRRADAEIRLSEYLEKKHVNRPAVGGKSDSVSIAEVLRIYAIEHAPTTAAPHLIAEHIEGLTPYWAHRMVSSIKGKTCREFATTKTQSMARRQLETLRASVNFFHREYGLDPVPAFTMPLKPSARERWLTRQEAARLLRSCRGVPHLRRFIIIGLYTGTRSASILGLSWLTSISSGWFDLNAMVLHRAGSAERKTKKRQPPVKIPPRLLAHLKRWKRMDGDMRHVIQWNGGTVLRVKKAFASAVERAGLEGKVTPHTLRHTCATWLMQRGVDLWDAAGFLGMSVQVLQENYGHHHPDFQTKAAEAIGRA